MARGYGFMAVACWCALTTAASAQYSQQGGQPVANPGTLPSAEYFTALNGGGPPAPPAAPNLAPAAPWANAAAAPGGYGQQPLVASNLRQAPPVPPQPMPGPPDPSNYSLLPGPSGSGPVVGGYSDNGAMIPDPVPPPIFASGSTLGNLSGWFGNQFNGYGVPVYGAFNQFNRCCPCQTPCGSCGTGGLGGTWGSGITNAAPAGSQFAGALANCGDAGGCATGAWYGSAAALFLWRSGGNRTWLTYNENNNADQLLNTQMANGNFYGGQITIGRYLSCNHAVEGTYWGVATSSSTVGLTDPNNKLGTPLDEQSVTMGGLPFGPGTGFSPFDGSHQQEIIRQDNIQNAEINFLTFPIAYNPMSRFRLALLSGVRYFRFQDSLIYGGTEYGTTWGQNGGNDEAFLNVRTTNNLLGTQIGARMTYFVTPRFSFFATPKMGIYSNMMGVRASLYSGAGSEAFNVSNTSTGFAAMGEIDLGSQFYITPRCAIFAAYRLIGVTGVATADTQIPPYLVDTAGFTQLNHNDALILQGVLAGASWNF